MKRPATALTVLATAALTGCAADPTRVAQLSDLEVCRSHGTYAASPLWAATAAPYREEVVKRRLISDEEWKLVAESKVRIGMSQCALYASWGAPDRENRTVTAGTTVIQHVYHSGLRYIRPKYVYTQDGRVRSFQD